MSRSSSGSSSTRTATLRPMPSTAQPSCGRPSIRIPASLASLPPRSNTTSLGHLIRASSFPTTSHTATAPISGSSAGDRRRETLAFGEHPRFGAGAATSAVRSGRRAPAAALASTPGGLLAGGDEGAVRRPGQRERPGPLVGGVGAAQMQTGMAERGGRTHRVTRHPQAAPARARRCRPRPPRGSRPRSRRVALVTGPIETMRVVGRQLRAAAGGSGRSARWRRR